MVLKTKAEYLNISLSTHLQGQQVNKVNKEYVVKVNI